MLDNLQILILALMQGFTEFLPVSSSAHLILVPKLFGWPDQGLIFDVAVHFGTLLAVIIYFKRELVQMSIDWVSNVLGKKEATQYSQLAWQLMIATLPVCLIGFMFHDVIAHVLRSPLVIAASTILFAFLLWFNDTTNQSSHSSKKMLSDMTWKNALKIGSYQVLALIPGVSRSGITLTAGLGLGFSREQASRFSFLLSIPVILSAVVLESLHLLQAKAPINYSPLLAAMSISGICAYICIHLFLKLVNQWGMLPFVMYRFMLGGILFFYFV